MSDRVDRVIARIREIHAAVRLYHHYIPLRFTLFEPPPASWREGKGGYTKRAGTDMQ